VTNEETRRPAGVLIRLSMPSDLDVLFPIYCEVMRDYATRATGAWDEDEQRRQYYAGFPVGRAQVILVGYDIAGAIDCEHHGDRWTVNNIEIAPEWQNHGIGTWLLRRLLRQARGEGIPVDLEVLKVNPARRLYERLGFAVTGETDTHWQMRATSD